MFSYQITCSLLYRTLIQHHVLFLDSSVWTTPGCDWKGKSTWSCTHCKWDFIIAEEEWEGSTGVTEAAVARSYQSENNKIKRWRSQLSLLLWANLQLLWYFFWKRSNDKKCLSPCQLKKKKAIMYKFVINVYNIDLKWLMAIILLLL